MRGALGSITAAVVGVILNLAVWFSIHTLFADVSDVERGPLELLVPDPATIDVVSLTLAVAAMVAMLRFRVGMITTLAFAAGAGLAWSVWVRA